ncbi:MAG: hypothetical protein GY699_15430 [Desulfobacteraceae bacterium]|nr:hypothetical protein [Desulfobacteraceae bacterium]
MKHLSKAKTIITTIMIASFIFSLNVLAAPPKKADRARTTIAPPSAAAAIKLPKPDLEAKVLRLSRGPGGKITVQGRIKNVGAGDFVSRSGQAAGQVMVHLPELSGPSAWPILSQVSITRLNRGQSINVRGVYTIPGFVRWGNGDLNSGECHKELNAKFKAWGQSMSMSMGSHLE